MAKFSLILLLVFLCFANAAQRGHPQAEQYPEAAQGHYGSQGPDGGPQPRRISPQERARASREASLERRRRIAQLELEEELAQQEAEWELEQQTLERDIQERRWALEARRRAAHTGRPYEEAAYL